MQPFPHTPNVRHVRDETQDETTLTTSPMVGSAARNRRKLPISPVYTGSIHPCRGQSAITRGCVREPRGRREEREALLALTSLRPNTSKGCRSSSVLGRSVRERLCRVALPELYPLSPLPMLIHSSNDYHPSRSPLEDVGDCTWVLVHALDLNCRSLGIARQAMMMAGLHIVATPISARSW